MLKQLPRIEVEGRYNNLLYHCDTLNYHLEPALKSTYSTIYHTSNVLQTRIIDIHDNNRIVPEEEIDRAIYYKTRNHDGYKLPYYMMRSEQLGMKMMGFVHAVVPSVFINRKQQLYLRISRTKERLETETDKSKRIYLEQQLESLRYERTVINNCFNIENFLHFRNWFWDLDYKLPVTLDALKWFLNEIGLLPYIAEIVETSPYKYHLYAKSEMIASEAHVRNWPKALSTREIIRITKPGYLEELYKKCPSKGGRDWFKVSIRGLPDPSRLDCIPIPIPEEAVLKNGLYYGDDQVYNTYLTQYKEIAKVLGADPKVFNETRCAQLPGFTNPKNGYVANIIYANKNALVLTTKIARTEISDKIKNWYVGNPNPFYVEPKNLKQDKLYHDNKDDVIYRYSDKIELIHSSERFNKKLPNIIENNEEDIEEEKKVITKVKKKINVPKKYTHALLPAGPSEYCNLNNLSNEVVWDMDITGRSNDMLLLFSRFSHKYIDLRNEEQQKKYFDSIIWEYFKSRKSKDLSSPTAKEFFFNHFKILCNHNSKSLAHTKQSIEVLNIYGSSLELQKQIYQQLDGIEGGHQFVTNETNKRLISILCNHAVSYGKVEKRNGKIVLTFQVPSSLLNEIHGYKSRLKFLEENEIYLVNSSYVAPVRSGSRLIKAGVCKKHTLMLTDKIISKEDILCNSDSKKEDEIKKIPSDVFSLSVPTYASGENDYECRRRFAYDIAQRIYRKDNENLISLEKVINKKEEEKSYADFSLEKILVNRIINEFLINKEIITLNKLVVYDEEEILGKRTFDGKLVCDIKEYLIKYFPSIFTPEKIKQYDNTLLKDNKTEYDLFLIDYYNDLFIDQYNTHIKELNKQLERKTERDKPLQEKIEQAIKNVEEKKAKEKGFRDIRWDELNKTRSKDPELIKEFERSKKYLYDVIREMDEIIVEKEKLLGEYCEFVLEHEDEYDTDGYLYSQFYLPCHLIRDSRLTEHSDKLPSPLKEMWAKPVQLQREEGEYIRVISELVEKILLLRSRVPLGPTNTIPCSKPCAFQCLKETKSKNKYVLSHLNRL